MPHEPMNVKFTFIFSLTYLDSLYYSLHPITLHTHTQYCMVMLYATSYTYTILHGYAICYFSFFLLYILHRHKKWQKVRTSVTIHFHAVHVCTQSHTVHIMCIFIYYYVQANVSFQLFPYTLMTAVTLHITHYGSLL